MLDELHQFARSLDFNPPDFTLDGKIHRFDRGGNGNAWYVGWQVFSPKTGEPFAVCVMGDWKTGEKHEYKPTKKMDKEDRDQIKKKMHEASEKSESARRDKQVEAKKTAEKLVSTMTPNLRGCDYAEHKKIMDVSTGAGTVLFEDGRVLVVPMRDEAGELAGAQMIHPDGRKLFITGQQTSGCFHMMGEPDGTILLAEGFATAATVRQATGFATVVCFNCNNLGHVAGIMRRKYPAAAIIIAGDDDKWTDGNPGRTKAEETAAKVGGAAIFPVFKNPEKGKTDFNDLHCTEGLEAVKVQLTRVEDQPEPTGYIPLGFDEGVYYFYNIAARSVVKSGTLSEKSMLELMPLDHWEGCYQGKRGINWMQAKSDVIEACRRAGVFNPARIRGMGVWMDGGRIIINNGKYLTVDSKKTTSHKSWYIYVQTKNKMPDLHKKPLTHIESAHLLRACDALKWRDSKSSRLLAGWIAVSRIAGALPIRPHVWLTGGSGTGKSTVLDRIIKPALGHESARLYLQGGSTEAGIRQSVKADSIPIMFDEFETTSENTKERTAAIVELLRQSWSHTSGYVVKGSADGNANHYVMNFAAIVSSIRINLDNDADRSRFSVLELAPHGSDVEDWDSLSKYIEIIDTEYGERLFARIAGMIPTILESYRVISRSLAGVVSQRFGQQYGMLLAGWYALECDTAMSKHVADDVVKDLYSKEGKDTTDDVECLTHLLTKRIFIDPQNNMTISEFIRIHENLKKIVDADEKNVSNEQREELKEKRDAAEASHRGLLTKFKDFGIFLDRDTLDLYVPSSHTGLSEIFRGTRWSLNWIFSLARLPNATKGHTKRFGASTHKCVLIPIVTISDLII